ncbi:hypothetical protein ZWY2020_045842 [Hordeum vulgare]|nr:hypothetical protein ZWY2020_045842 [Hordeum vulgare]
MGVDKRLSVALDEMKWARETKKRKTLSRPLLEASPGGGDTFPSRRTTPTAASGKPPRRGLRIAVDHQMEQRQSITMSKLDSSCVTVLDDLPESIIAGEILIRLPAEDILRCRAVCKLWCHATSARDFLLAHHRRQPSLLLIDCLNRDNRFYDGHLCVFCGDHAGATSCKLRPILCSDGIVVDIHMMQDYEAEVWAFKYRIDLSALKASLPPDLRVRCLRKIVVLGKHELLIELDAGHIVRCDIDGKFLGHVKCSECEESRVHITPHSFQENIIPLPFLEMQEDYGMPEAEDDDETHYFIWPYP